MIDTAITETSESGFMGNPVFCLDKNYPANADKMGKDLTRQAPLWRITS